jgi:hypothetical protein
MSHETWARYTSGTWLWAWTGVASAGRLSHWPIFTLRVNSYSSSKQCGETGIAEKGIDRGTDKECNEIIILVIPTTFNTHYVRVFNSDMS